MSHSISHYHKKGRIESNMNGNTFITPDEIVVEETVIEAAPPAATDTTTTDTDSGGDGESSSSSPEDNSFGFHNLLQLERNTDSTATNNNIYLGGTASSHQKYSREQDYVPPTTTTSSPTGKPTHSMESLIREGNLVEKAPPVGKPAGGGGGGGGGSYISGGSHHQKYSLEQNYVEPTTSPPTPTPPPTPPAYSLRDVHSSNNNSGGGAGMNAGVHQKYSQEQNGVNPNELPDIWIAPEPTGSPTQQVVIVDTPSPTIDIRRVAPAPEEDDNELYEQKCKSVEGVYGKATRNGGVVLRYQYELVQEAHDRNSGGSTTREDGAIALMTNVLPVLEERINDALIPVFFQECLNNNNPQVRKLQEREVEDTQGGQQHSMLRHKHTNKISGIEASPADFPLSQSECQHDNTILQTSTTYCHRIEGALTLHFPPNYSISTLLVSTTLTTLRAIQDGMTNGSLKNAHADIRKLHFLEGSYDLRPIVPQGVVEGDGMSTLDESSGGTTNDKLGLILGILIPLLVVCCCCVGLFVVRKIMLTKPPNDDDSEIGSFEEDGIMHMAKQRQRHEAGRAQVGSSFTSSRGGGCFGHEDDEGDTASDDSEESRSESSMSVVGSGNRSVESAVVASDDDDESDSGSEYSEYSEHSEEEEEEDDDSHNQSNINQPGVPVVDPSKIYSEYSHSHDQDYYNDGTKYQAEENGYRSDNGYSSTASSVNPLECIFENQRREKEKKKKMKKRQKRIRKRYERMSRSGDLSTASGRSAASSRCN